MYICFGLRSKLMSTNKSIWTKLPDVFYVERDTDRVLDQNGEFLFELSLRGTPVRPQDNEVYQILRLVDYGALVNLGPDIINGVLVRKYMKQ